MACTKQITVSIENLLGYNRRNKIGHDNSVKQNTYLSYYKGHRYGHAFRQRAPQQPIDVDLSYGTGGTASFVVTPGMSYTLDSLPQGTKILKVGDRYLLKYNETTIGEIVISSYISVVDDIVINRGQSEIQIGTTPIVLEDGDEIEITFEEKGYLKFTANNAGSTVKLNKNGSPTEVTLERSINGNAWETYTIGDTIRLTNVGDRVYFRNTSTTTTGFSTGASNYYKFVMTGSINGGGDINYLLNKNSATTVSNYCYYSLFSGCGSLIVSPELPATTLNTYCYYDMFSGCTGLTTVPSLPATTLAEYCYDGMFTLCTSLTTVSITLPATTLATGCYSNMFASCNALTTAPTISATTLANNCCSNMFERCTSLTTPPSTLAATTLAPNCYSSMFRKCTSLTTAPTISATTLANNCCVDMFDGCTSLAIAPSLPATTLAANCYDGMFEGCTSLTATPTLPATTLYKRCYYGMFNGCTGLTTIVGLPATILAEDCYKDMFRGCTSLTTPPALPATNLSSPNYAYRCYQYMFAGCTGLTTVPSLPATKLAQQCYEYMFSGCTNLETLPSLPSMKLDSSCYYRMFLGCSKIKISETQTGEYQNEYRIPTSGTTRDYTSGSAKYMFENTGGTFTGTPTINTTYYTSNAIVS